MDIITNQFRNAAVSAAQTGALVASERQEGRRTLMQLVQRTFAGYSELYGFIADRVRNLTRVQAGVAVVAVTILGATIYVAIKRYQRNQPLPQPFRQPTARPDNRFAAARERAPTPEQEAKRVKAKKQKKLRQQARKQEKRGQAGQGAANAPAEPKIDATAPLRGRRCDPRNLDGIDAQIINELVNIESSPAYLCIHPRSGELLVRKTDGKGPSNYTALFKIHFSKSTLNKPQVTALDSDWKGRPKKEQYHSGKGKPVEIKEYENEKLDIQRVLRERFKLDIKTEARRLHDANQAQ